MNVREQDRRDREDAWNDLHPTIPELEREKQKFGGIIVTPALLRKMGHFFSPPYYAELPVSA